ncbi:undecaprenyl diphosphate synthase [Hyphomonas polymorpha PS728]|uniref:Isoprenyl transferase n=1 Tax=Hyphomonas polymorpha PS728 TaxID=1280954 RepID=A0A062V6N0_9PROT|nr:MULTISPECIES: isoprenyl transferase [Hyphomonas]AXE64207.1 di-trans,poly-cis-decaprenylcistransferase [Hyphomonas sp. CACIAM 19H1]KCZ97730.1 undecaprenyl diphosphate synthase [Hyphomonas polymorpha PS728]
MSRAAAPLDPVPAGDQPAAPRHVAIIMDGNGRWATARHLPRSAGHERGVEALRRTVDAAGELGIKYLTVFSFSTENWRRPPAEVNTLFALLKAYVQRDLGRLKAEGVRIRIIGQREGLPPDIASLVNKAELETSGNTRFNLTIAFNYGARDEILRAVQAIARDVKAGVRDENISESEFAAYLDTSGLPDPDLLIRTSGEFRISNFLLWQAAYAELLFCDVLWPDFGRSHLEEALKSYNERERRYGAVTPGAG